MVSFLVMENLLIQAVSIIKVGKFLKQSEMKAFFGVLLFCSDKCGFQQSEILAAFG